MFTINRTKKLEKKISNKIHSPRYKPLLTFWHVIAQFFSEAYFYFFVQLDYLLIWSLE